MHSPIMLSSHLVRHELLHLVSGHISFRLANGYGRYDDGKRFVRAQWKNHEHELHRRGSASRSYLIWQIENASMMAKSIHIHDVQARIFDFNGATPTSREMSVKDTVVAPNERAGVLR